MQNIAIALLACVTVGLKVSVTLATEPYILSTGAQEFAVEVNLAKELGIDWSEASPGDIAEYVHTLTAIDVVAQKIAEANNSKEPSFNDYQAAAAAWCKIDLPNKPEDIAEFSALLEGAYVSTKKQESITNAVGPVLLQGSLEGFENFLINEKPGIDEYQKQILNFSSMSK